MLNFVVVDDNDKSRKKLIKIILSYMMKNQMEFKIHEFNDYSLKLLNYIKRDKMCTIYILDLELPNGDGIDIARYIRNECNNWTSPVIIVTAHTSLYYEVYKQRLQVLDFIGKCENLEKNLPENIEICFKMLNKEKVYKYKYKNIEYNIKLSNIDYIIRDGRQIKIVTTSKDYYQNKSITKIKQELPKYFEVSTKGVIINLKNIDKIDWNNKKVYFKDGKSDYIVSYSHKKEIENNDFL